MAAIQQSFSTLGSLRPSSSFIPPTVSLFLFLSLFFVLFSFSFLARIRCWRVSPNDAKHKGGRDLLRPGVAGPSSLFCCSLLHTRTPPILVLVGGLADREHFPFPEIVARDSVWGLLSFAVNHSQGCELLCSSCCFHSPNPCKHSLPLHMEYIDRWLLPMALCSTSSLKGTCCGRLPLLPRSHSLFRSLFTVRSKYNILRTLFSVSARQNLQTRCAPGQCAGFRHLVSGT